MSRMEMCSSSPGLIKRLLTGRDWAAATQDMATSKAVAGMDRVFISGLTVVTGSFVAVKFVEGDGIALHAVDDNSDAPAFNAMERLVSALQALLSTPSMAGDKERRIGQAREDEGIGDGQNRRAVDQHIVIICGPSFDQFAHLVRSQQFRRILRRRSGRDHRQ